MSVRAIDWVFRQTLRPATVKFVLVALADNCNDSFLAYPSISQICLKTSLDDRTVRSALDRLVKDGWIEDTGKRVGQTGQVRVFRMNLERPPILGALPKTPIPVPKDSHPCLENRQEPSVPLSPNGANLKSRPASEEHVIAFCKSIGIRRTDAEYFWSHWQGNGFKNNGKAMKDWQATIRSWALAGHLPSQRQQRGKPPPAPYRGGPEESTAKRLERQQRLSQQHSEADDAERERINEIQRQKVRMLSEELRKQMKNP